MPLVTRSSNQGVIFKQSTTPNWSNADAWIDTDDSSFHVNRSGTDVQTGLGTLAQGDILYASANDTIAALPKGSTGQFLKIGATVPSWATLTPGLEILDNHLAAGAESTYTYTPGTALSFDNYSEFIVEIDGKSTATLSLLMRINGISTAVYSVYGWSNDSAGAYTGITSISATSWRLLSSTTLDAARTFRGTVSILADQLSANDGTGGFSRFNSTTKGTEYAALSADPSTDALSSITILTSTSTWQTGTRITIYGVKRL